MTIGVCRFLCFSTAKRNSFVRNLNWFLKENLKRPTRKLVSSTAFFFGVWSRWCGVPSGVLQICSKKSYVLLQDISRNDTLEKRVGRLKLLNTSARVFGCAYFFFVHFSIETHFFKFHSDCNDKKFAETRRMNFDQEILLENFRRSLIQFSSVSLCYSAVPLWLSCLAKADEKSVKIVFCLDIKFRQSGR